MKTKSFSLIAVTILLTGCFAPKPVARLYPKKDEKKGYWNMGQQFVQDENNHIAYECAFKKVEFGSVVYYVKVTNNSDSDILVSPENFEQVVSLIGPNETISNKADDPEMVLLNIDLESSQARATAKNAAVTGIVTSAAIVGTAAAIAASKKDDEKKAEALEVVGDVGNIAVNTSMAVMDEAHQTVAQNQQQYNKLSDSFLRKTTLFPGYYIDGEVRFPFNERAVWYNIHLGARNSKVEFNFYQILFYPSQL
jgi:hypothetical protein